MKVSIVVPIYNAEKYIQKMAESVFSQGYQDWEMILVDDGSKDSSGQMCDDLAEKDSRIRVFHTPNRGVTAARKYGAEMAEGEWIYFVDADDAMAPDSMEIMLEAGHSCDIVIGNKQIVSGTSAVDEIMNVKNEYLNSLEFLSGLIVNKISQYITGRIFRKELFENGTIDIPAELIMAEDFIMNVQLGNKANRIALVKDIVYKYYVYDESVSHTFRSSLAYEEKFCNCLENAVRQGDYYEELKDELAFQNLRALKMGFMSQKGKVDMKNEFLCKTLKQSRGLSLTRGWKLFVMLVPFKHVGYSVLKRIG